MAISEKVYNDRDNGVDILLKEDGVVYALDDVTRMTCVDTDGGFTTIDSAVDATTFNWTTGTVGKVVLSFGHQSVTAGSYLCKIYVYTGTWDDGIFWDYIGLIFID